MYIQYINVHNIIKPFNMCKYQYRMLASNYVTYSLELFDNNEA